jgi:hypothetical protein
MAVPQGAPAQTFRLIQLPEGFYQRAAERDRRPMPESERARVVARASADFSGASYYNRPGGTWEDYLTDWYGCEAVTGGPHISGGVEGVVESPTMLTPRKAGIGVTIGDATGTVQNLDALHDENRRACMHQRGWRRVTSETAEAARVEALNDAAFMDWVKGAIGSEHPVGTLESDAYARLPDNPAIAPDATPPGAPSLHVSDGGDPHAPVMLRPGEGALVLAFRRPDKGSAGQRAAIALRRYDLAAADLAASGAGDKSRSAILVESQDRAGYELQIVRLAPGYYVLDGTSTDGKPPDKSNCFGAPLIEVPAGQAVYAGDWVPYHGVKLGKGKILPDALVLVGDVERARAALAGFQPALAEGLQPMAVANGASYACLNPDIVLDRFSLAGAPAAP